MEILDKEIKTFFLKENSELPLVIESIDPQQNLIEYGLENKSFIEETIHKYGGILFRNFKVNSAENFNDFLTAMFPELIEYKERSSPRQQVNNSKVYTSTEYPADQYIYLHNENSYANVWPLKICFFCDVEPKVGGETPIANTRNVYNRISRTTREKFEEKGVMYVRNLTERLGLSWKSVFQTDNKEIVEEYCKNAGYEYEWKENKLQTKRVGPAVVFHPYTKEPIWFNHAVFFHYTTLPKLVQDTLLMQMKEEDFPNNTYYGTGEKIENEVLEEIRNAYAAETVTFKWKKGDVLLLDNMLTAHARSPFKGERRILVSMAEPYSIKNINEVK